MYYYIQYYTKTVVGPGFPVVKSHRTEVTDSMFDWEKKNPSKTITHIVQISEDDYNKFLNSDQ